ncbi:spindle and kinetochore-associated protein 3 [Xyrichtys novacula]|uniref:Spindle and kinetochore-associated protein 3 n=1 Tax=Xyrichtys novacula TaxID=13765 RepID=A0AAV1GZH7_XYRNO|nr:spindle and kinetochore-associated protein 3 [Xyrichtys novacula]
MNPTVEYFSKLRTLAVTLETETAKIQQDFENRNNEDDDDSGTAARAMRAYHELNRDVGNMKGQIQEHLAQQKARENELSSFIKACKVAKQRVTQDIQTLKGHWEKYGYQAPQDTQKQTKSKSQELEAEDVVADVEETNSAEEEVEGQEEAGGDPSKSPPGPPSFPGTMRTPQLSDFGLSEMHLKRALAGAAWCTEVPPMPEMSLPHPTLSTPAPPPMPLTPKCALRMDDDELQTPQMHDFGISEHTLCLNNDFTMDLLRKNAKRPQRPSLDIPAPPGEPLMKSLQTQANKLESPEPPVFCTPGFKIKKTNYTPQAESNCGTESPAQPECLPSTPEVPAFQTLYVNRLASTKKSAWQDESIVMQTDGFESQTTQNGTTGSKFSWKYNEPDISTVGIEDLQMPEMPDLEFQLGNTLLSRGAKKPGKTTQEYKEVTKGPTVSRLEVDEPTQEFRLGTPRIRMGYQEPSTPEMPDLSSVTQDICKLLSETQKKNVIAVVSPTVRPEKDKSRALSMPLVSQSEFQSLPCYLRQMTLNNLNQAVHSINNYTQELRGEKTEFQMEELRRITNVGTKTPVYILCLAELKRLKHIGGTSNTSIYQLSTHC